MPLASHGKNYRFLIYRSIILKFGTCNKEPLQGAIRYTELSYLFWVQSYDEISVKGEKPKIAILGVSLPKTLIKLLKIKIFPPIIPYCTLLGLEYIYQFQKD